VIVQSRNLSCDLDEIQKDELINFCEIVNFVVTILATHLR